MIPANQYVLLMASLPPLGRLFENDRIPISQIKLENRLEYLTERDKNRLSSMVDLVAWTRLSMDITDQEIIEGTNKFCREVRRPAIRAIVQRRLEMHTILSALRQRNLGRETPPEKMPWGYGTWVPHIERNWMQPGFNLYGIFPWIEEAERLLKEQETFNLEKHMLKAAWDLLSEQGEGHYFDFIAVVVYVFKWDIIKRWTRYDPERALTRFHEITTSGMGDYANIFSEE